MTMTMKRPLRISSIVTILSILSLYIFADPPVTVIAYAKLPTCHSPSHCRRRHHHHHHEIKISTPCLSLLCRYRSCSNTNTNNNNNDSVRLLLVRGGATNTVHDSQQTKRNRYYYFLSLLFATTKNNNDHAKSNPTTERATRKSSSSSSSSSSNNYHLLWSPNFLMKTFLSMSVWWCLQLAWITFYGGSSTMMSSMDGSTMTCHDLPHAKRWQTTLSSSVILPLLSSSCCAIQLIINAISGWGCAGFNTFLGPIRPLLLSLLLMSTWKLHVTGRSLGWTIVSLFIAFLPELVDIWNTNRSQQWQSRHSNNNDAIRASFLHEDEKSVASSSSSSSSSDSIEAKVRLSIPTMGCVACVNKVDASIRGCISATNNIQEEKSWLADNAAKGGVAELTISGKTREEINGVIEEVIAAVQDAGFVCKVASLQIQ